MSLDPSPPGVPYSVRNAPPARRWRDASNCARQLAAGGPRLCRVDSAGRTAVVSVLVLLATCLGCGTMKSQTATQQLLLSDAVDKSVASIDFRILRGKRVFLDTTYVRPVKGSGFVNADYITSTLRQQLFAAGCLVQENKQEAEYVVEARVGALGADGHEVTYGIPASNILSSAATLITNAPAVPAIPEIALAKRNDNSAAAKIAVFAYHRESREPLWQSGLAVSRSRAKDVWFLGAGPFQRGAIYEGTQFAGQQLEVPLVPKSSINVYADRILRRPPNPPEIDEGEIRPVGFDDDNEVGQSDDENSAPSENEQSRSRSPDADAEEASPAEILAGEPERDSPRRESLPRSNFTQPPGQ